MALSQEVLDTIAFADKMGFTKLHLQPPAVTREAMKHAPPAGDPTEVGDVINTIIPEDEIAVRIYIPKGEGPFPVISYFHGGGFVLLSLDTHDEICRQLCARSGCMVMSVDYKLAPENPYPQGPESSIAVLRMSRPAFTCHEQLNDKGRAGYMMVKTGLNRFEKLRKLQTFINGVNIEVDTRMEI